LNNPCDDIFVPTTAPSALDAKVELAIIIGKDCKNVDKASALDYVLGYIVANDVTARDIQARVTQWGFDGFCPLRPVIVRADLPGFGSQRIQRPLAFQSFLARNGISFTKSKC
jgi:2-keto-4-pentenoate hydratase/2-oxohepta-3-ene-1,7-dioic acid hydratase in catechol pathway